MSWHLEPEREPLRDILYSQRDNGFPNRTRLQSARLRRRRGQGKIAESGARKKDQEGKARRSGPGGQEPRCRCRDLACPCPLSLCCCRLASPCALRCGCQGLQAPAARTTAKSSRSLEVKHTQCRPRNDSSDAKSANSRARMQDQEGRARKSEPGGQENYAAPRHGFWAHMYLHAYVYKYLRNGKSLPQVPARPQVLAKGLEAPADKRPPTKRLKPRALCLGASESRAQDRQAKPRSRSADTTRQDKTRQDKTRQDKTRQDKTRQDKTRQDKTRQDKTRHYRTRQDKTRQDKTIQNKQCATECPHKTPDGSQQGPTTEGPHGCPDGPHHYRGPQQSATNAPPLAVTWNDYHTRHRPATPQLPANQNGGAITKRSQKEPTHKYRTPNARGPTKPQDKAPTAIEPHVLLDRPQPLR
jgi:hypothetical protein